MCQLVGESCFEFARGSRPCSVLLVSLYTYHTIFLVIAVKCNDLLLGPLDSGAGIFSTPWSSKCFVVCACDLMLPVLKTRKLQTGDADDNGRVAITISISSDMVCASFPQPTKRGKLRTSGGRSRTQHVPPPLVPYPTYRTHDIYFFTRLVEPHSCQTGPAAPALGVTARAPPCFPALAIFCVPRPSVPEGVSTPNRSSGDVEK